MSDLDVLTSREVADRLDIGVRQVIRLVDRGDLTPAGKLPGLRGAYIFNRSDIEAIAANPSPTHSTPAGAVRGGVSSFTKDAA